MGKTSGKEQRQSLHKRTCQGGKAKRASMPKARKRSYKAYRGQGR